MYIYGVVLGWNVIYECYLCVNFVWIFRVCGDCCVLGILCMWMDCVMCCEGCVGLFGECIVCFGGVGEVVFVFMIVVFVVLVVFVVVGFFYSVFVVIMVG